MTYTFRVAIVLLGLVLVGRGHGLLLAQAPVVGSGFISGQVVEGGSTRPVPGATVALYLVTPRGPAREVIADAQGRYVFPGLPEGEFRLTARKAGWRTGAFGLDRPAEGLAPSGEVISLAAGARARANVLVWRPALISGYVTDEAGEPVAAARVNAVRWTATRGRRALSSSNLAVTDDRGRFTLSVQPGEYMIRATSEQVRIVKARPHVLRHTFHPRSHDSSSGATVTVRFGQERNGIDIQMSLEPAFRVSGVVSQVDPGRMPPRLELLAEGETQQQYLARPIEAGGRFAIDYIRAGRYVLQTPPGNLGSQEPSDNGELWARVPIEITNSDLDVRVDLRRRLLVSGRISFDGGAPSAPAGGFSVGVRLFREEELPLTDVSPGYASVGPDGRFTVAVPPGRYVVASGVSIRSIQDLRNGPGPAAARAWSLRTATHGGRDVADVPLAVTTDVSGLELTFTDRQPVLRGRVTTRQGSVESAQLLAFPVDESIWYEFPVGRRLQVIRLPADGSFELRNVPEGDYFLAAVRGMPGDSFAQAWRNPAFLDALTRRARRVTLLEGQTVTQDVELSDAPAVNEKLAPPPVVLQAIDRAVVREIPPNAPTSGATISGIVVAAGSNRPIPAARVGLTQGAAGLNAGGAFTDSEGRFTLFDVPAGQHTLYVSRAEYVSTVFGAARPGDPGTPVTVASGQRISGLSIEMLRGAALGGTVVDQNGQPLPGVQIGIRAYRWTARGRELVQQRGTALGPATTDERGEYRTFGLAPGDYIIEATVQGANSAMPVTTPADIAAAERPAAAGGALAGPRVEVMYTPMFYPNTPDPAGAQTIKLRSGDDQVIDFHFRLIPTATVSGVVRTSDGNPPGRLSVNLSQNDAFAPPVPRSRLGSLDGTGAFTIRGVPPGRYLLTTSQITAGSAPLAGALNLFVDGDVNGVVLDVVPMTTVTGTVRGDVPAAVGQPTIRISLSPLPGTPVPPNQSRSAVIGADNRFTIPNVPPGRYRFELTGPNNVVKPRVAAQLVQGVDTSDAGLEVKGGGTLDVDVELITSEAKVAGRVRERGGQPSSRPYVVLFARDARAWTPPSRRIFGLRPDQTGRYLFPDVPAGDYLITLLADVEPNEWFDPALLARMASSATPVTVRRGDTLEIDLETR